MERVAIVAAVRTPIGRFLGAFADLTACRQVRDFDRFRP